MTTLLLMPEVVVEVPTINPETVVFLTVAGFLRVSGRREPCDGQQIR